MKRCWTRFTASTPKSSRIRSTRSFGDCASGSNPSRWRHDSSRARHRLYADGNRAMSRGRSLALRVALYLSAAQLVAIGAGWSCALILGLFGLEGFATSLDEVAFPRTREMIIASIRRDADGALLVAPTPALRAELALNPKLKYAVFEPTEMKAAPGSSPELVRALTDSSALFIRAGSSSRSPQTSKAGRRAISNRARRLTVFCRSASTASPFNGRIYFSRCFTT